MDMDEKEQEEERSDTLPFYRVYLCGSFCLQRRVGSAYITLDTREWGGHRSPRTMIKALLCALGRRASRGTLLTQMWPEADGEQANRELNVAVSRARKLLSSVEEQECLKTEQEAGGFSLAAQTVIWVDIDASLALLDQAEQCGRASIEAMALLEQALAYFQRGAFLEDEWGEWSENRRAIVERRRYRGQRWLAEVYTSQGKLGQAEEVLHMLLAEDPTDEDVLCQLMALLHQHGLTHQSLVLYKQTSAFFAKEELELSEATKGFAEQLHAKKSFLSLEALSLQSSLFNSSSVQGIIERRQTNRSNQVEKEQSMDVSRRDFLYLIGMGGMEASLVTSAYLQQMPTRFFPRLSDTSLHHLATITTHLRALYLQGDIPVVHELFAHFSLLQHALNTTMDDGQRHELWRILAQTQLLCRFSMAKREPIRAKTFNEVAIASARNSGDTLLTGAAIGHLAHFYLRIERAPTKASQFLNEAQALIQEQDALTGWFALLSAQIAAIGNNREHCEKYLHLALDKAHQTYENRDPYFTDFSVASVHIFAGNCFLTVKQSQKAHEWLTGACLEDLSPNRHASAYYDITRAYVASHQLEAAQEYALKSIDCAVATNNGYILPRIVSLAKAIRQKDKDNTCASTIEEYALSMMHRQKRRES